MNIKLNIDGKEYEVVSREQKKLPKTWDELKYEGGDLTYLPISYIALRKLEILRDIYNDGWKPDWTDKAPKHIIIFYSGEVDTYDNYSTHHFFHFKTAELRDEFLNNFRDLIEEAKDLL